MGDLGRTSRGVPITDALITELSDQAEAGYDVVAIMRRRLDEVAESRDVAHVRLAALRSPELAPILAEVIGRVVWDEAGWFLQENVQAARAAADAVLVIVHGIAGRSSVAVDAVQAWEVAMSFRGLPRE
jgi:uncharacterized protein YbjT (DUF2867 family)